ncbi:hypothetical protein BRADI_2g19285v3 [Brachypodium distachyon]|uniref:Reverse transcriptase zinc-binding domain-containing protein n=1 Tax=Brachypodium distachyon TaxID=15368 RepID=A0A2K2D9C5_BRADI|nr:hypothetical protein BRADI_2g19285v3 [Brachypodium distachyon]
MFIKLGDGSRAKFWSDNWLPGGRAVQDWAPSLFSFVRDSSMSVAVAFPTNRSVRDIRGGLSTQALADYLKLWDLVFGIALIAHQPDQACWRFSSSGTFS